jgi:hypothetical protein
MGMIYKYQAQMAPLEIACCYQVLIRDKLDFA